MPLISLRRKFTIGLFAVGFVAVILLLGVRMLGKTARFHYLEREHLAQIMTLSHGLDLSEMPNAQLMTKDQALRALDKARAVAGSVPVELTAPEVWAFKLLGFAKVVEMPGQALVHLDRVRSVLTASSEPALNKALAEQIRTEVAAASALGNAFGPLVEETTQFVKALVLTLNLLGVAAVLVVFLLIRRATLAPLQQALDTAQRIAQGDLAGPDLPTTADEVGQLNAAINDMKHNLSRVVGEVRERSHAVAGSMAEVATGSGDLSSRTEMQAATLQRTAASVSEMSQSVRHIGQQVRAADQQASEAGEVVSQGGQAVSQVVTRMDEILAASRRIADINGVINGIAYQTNILALNAAVEAARAGEHGRGFAVVAGEVRSLAGRSAEAAREIATLIQDTTGRVEQGAADVSRAGETMGQVLSSVQKVSQLVNGIAQELNAQESGLEQIDHAMADLDAGTQQNAAIAEQSASAAESVRSEADRLVQTVGRFRLPA